MFLVELETILKMSCFSFLLCFLSIKFYVFSLNNEKHTLEDIYDLVVRIDESLRKEDRVRELTHNLQIDLTLKKMEKNLEEIAERLDSDDNLDRHLPRDVRTNLLSIGNRIENMENNVESLQDIMKKMNDDMQILSEVEERTEDLKKELNHKLTKMMNVLSSLYQISKDLRNDLGNTKRSEERGETDVDLPATAYMIDSLENLERKIKEQMSILSVQMKTELDSIKTITSSILYQCENEENDESYSKTDNSKLKHDSNQITNDILDDIQNNLNRSQREIKEELRSGMQNIENKISHLANMTSKNRCIDRDSRENHLDVEETKVESCVTVSSPTARNCADLRKAGNTCDGKYIIIPNQKKAAIMVYCDMTTDGGGWTILMRRGEFGNKEITFDQNWKSYRVGFGDLEGEFWLGNDNIHLLSSDSANEMRMELKSVKGETKNFTFRSFYIENDIQDFRLHIGPSVNETLTIIREFNRRPFVTYDRIMDQPGENCARKYKGAWWYRRYCIYPDLTSERLDPKDYDYTSLNGMQSSLWREGGLLCFLKILL